jgi:ribonuclease HI
VTRPTLSEALLAIAESEPLARASAKLGCDREMLVGVLLEAAGGTFSPPKAVQQRLLDTPPAPPKLPPASPITRAVLYSDGASRGNPGPAGAGAVLVLGEGKAVRLGRFLGVQTNNVAEYQGVIIGLEKALELGVRELDVRADSMLAMMQLKGEWKLKNEGLKPLFDRARQLIGRFDKVTFRHIPREQNGAADEMSNRAIDERM